MTDTGPEIDWALTTWEGSRREQLRRWRRLSLRERLRAIEEMADISRRFEEMRGKRKRGDAGSGRTNLK
jgi:CRISPR-associated protein Csx17